MIIIDSPWDLTINAELGSFTLKVNFSSSIEVKKSSKYLIFIVRLNSSLTPV